MIFLEVIKLSVKEISSIYQPYIVRIPLWDSEILVRHVELLDQEATEFPHVHNSFEIYYSLKGVLKMNVAGHIVGIPPQQLLLVSPNTPHGRIYEPDSEREYFIIIFDLPDKLFSAAETISASEEVHELKNILSEFITDYHSVYHDHNQCTEIIEQIAFELKERRLGWQSIIKGLYLEFILKSFRNIVPSTLNIASHDSQNLNLAIEISKYLHANYDKEITLQSVADTMHVTPRHINRVFEACFGTTFSNTLSLFRLNHAKEYLYKTSYSIDKIANLVGFSSSRTLHRLFQENENITATQYRKNVRKSMTCDEYIKDSE
ncbi:MAG: AraC family transcriptional regulator [Eubacteriaceae bacterium]|nr:AraC family transcriptional regulator [Eubacteriaceae bacterium]